MSINSRLSKKTLRLKNLKAHQKPIGFLAKFSRRHLFKGYTLLELLVTTAAFAVIVGLASPMAGSLSSRLQSKNGLGLLTASVKLAFSSANHLGQEVVICGSSDGVNCSGSDNWNTGWIIYFDDGGRNIIHVSDSPRNIDIIVDGFPNNNQITIQPTRLSVEESATFGTFAACQLPNNRAAAGLIVSNHGYVRAATDSNADGDVENHNDANARCT